MKYFTLKQFYTYNENKTLSHKSKIKSNNMKIGIFSKNKKHIIYI